MINNYVEIIKKREKIKLSQPTGSFPMRLTK